MNGGIVMEDSKHILLVANSLSTAELSQIQNTITEMAKEGLNHKISILYVKPYLPSCYLHVPSMVAVSEDFEEEAKESLQQVGQQLDIPAQHQWIATGRIRQETLKIAATLGVDYILSSQKVSKELHNVFSIKKNRVPLPVKNINNLAA